MGGTQGGISGASDSGGRQALEMDCITQLLQFHPPSAGAGLALPWEAHSISGAPQDPCLWML